MDGSGKLSLEEIRAFLRGTAPVEFTGQGRAERYAWMEQTLRQHGYERLGRSEKGLVRQFVAKMTGLSRAQIARLIGGYVGNWLVVAPVNCVVTSDVENLGVDGCFATGAEDIIFSDFQVIASAGYLDATIGIIGSSVVDNVVNLTFSIGGIVVDPNNQNGFGYGDIVLYYTVTGGLNAVDMKLTATPVSNTTPGSLTITEIACDQEFVDGLCEGTILANIAVTSSGQLVTNIGPFGSTDPVYIQKDIQFNGATTSQFVNSHHFDREPPSEVPEPMTLSMVGLGLLGVGVLGHRRSKK